MFLIKRVDINGVYILYHVIICLYFTMNRRLKYLIKSDLGSDKK
jgi:hypothetical protein